MPISGHATSVGTNRYRSRFEGRAAPGHFREEQDLILSSIGIGTYLGNANPSTDKNYTEAVVRAVELGTNVIDTAANYRFQRSERSIGAALQYLTTDCGYSREELVVCTKGGYLPFDGAPPRNIRAYIEDTFVKPGIANFDDFVGGSHCMTPAYLQNQLDQSLANLNLECIDVYYIHNPESQLGQISQSEFEHRLKAAFDQLERSREQGKIRMYGIATWNGFRVTSRSREYHSLARITDLARQVGGNSHGFRLIQLPFNLGMPEAWTLQNQLVEGVQLSVLEASSKIGITAVASASMLQGRVAQGLPDEVRQTLGSLSTDAQSAIQFVRSTPGITTALVGMSRVEHVEENLALVNVEPVGKAQFAKLFDG